MVGRLETGNTRSEERLLAQMWRNEGPRGRRLWPRLFSSSPRRGSGAIHHGHITFPLWDRQPGRQATKRALRPTVPLGNRMGALRAPFRGDASSRRRLPVRRRRRWNLSGMENVTWTKKPTWLKSFPQYLTHSREIVSRGCSEWFRRSEFNLYFKPKL